MAKWSIDLKKQSSEIIKEDFPKPPGYCDNFDTVRHHALPLLYSTLFFVNTLKEHTLLQKTSILNCHELLLYLLTFLIIA